MAGTALSLAATGLSASGQIDQGQVAAQNAQAQALTALTNQQTQLGDAANALAQASQTNQADTYQAQNLSDQAAYGRVAGLQTDTDMKLQLAGQLANISVTRGASGLDPSPTGYALSNRTEAVSDQDREQQVGNIMAQVGMDQTGAAYYAQAGTDALAIGRMQAQEYQQNAQAYADQAQIYSGNAATDSSVGFLGAGGTLLSGLAGPVGKLNLPTGF